VIVPRGGKGKKGGGRYPHFFPFTQAGEGKRRGGKGEPKKRRGSVPFFSLPMLGPGPREGRGEGKPSVEGRRRKWKTSFLSSANLGFRKKEKKEGG